ncbi:MAG: hypothetical protein GEU79_04775 [Acidimicrobiia bacterium]|nr:hypothetical protein [Acidimicrobiia bacterium]
MTNHSDPPAVEPMPLPKWLLRVMNPVMRWLAKKKWGPAEIAVLAFTGVKSGRSYEIPVGILHLDEGVGVLTRGKWRHNFRGGHPVTVTAGGRTRETVGTLVTDPAEVADELHRGIRRHGYQRAGRRMGLKVNVDHEPSLDELTDAVRRTSIAIVYLGGGALPNR